MASATLSGNSSCTASAPCGRTRHSTFSSPARASISARERRGVLRPEDEADRSRRPRGREPLGLAAERVELAGDEGGRREAGVGLVRDIELVLQELGRQPGGIGQDVTQHHHLDDRARDVERVERRSHERRLDHGPDPRLGRLVAVHHRRQRPAPGRCDEDEAADPAGQARRETQGEPGTVTGRHHAGRRRQLALDELGEEARQHRRVDPKRRACLPAEAGPVGNQRLDAGTEGVHQGPHLLAGRNGAQCRQEENRVAMPDAVQRGLDRAVGPAPRNRGRAEVRLVMVHRLLVLQRGLSCRTNEGNHGCRYPHREREARGTRLSLQG